MGCTLCMAFCTSTLQGGSYTYIHYLYTEYGIPDICTQYSNRALIDHGNLGSDFSLSFSTVKGKKKKRKEKEKMGHLMGLDVLSCTTIVPPRDPHEDRRNPLSRTLSPPGITLQISVLRPLYFYTHDTGYSIHPV